MAINTRKSTSAKNILDVLKNGSATISYATATCKDTEEITDITSEKFTSDLESYANSGCFSDSVRFEFESKHDYIGLYMSNVDSYCNVTIFAKMERTNPNHVNYVENDLSKNIIKEISEKIESEKEK